MAALEGAVAGAEREDGAVPVAEDLHLDMAARRQVGLDEDLAVTEGGEGLGGGRLQGGGQFVEGVDDAHAASAAARGRLDEDGQVGPVTAPGSSGPSSGTPASAMSLLARVLEAIASIASGSGPIQMSPASRTARAKAAFSERKP